MTHTHTTTDVAIIGAGPTGLFAVFECGMLGLSCQVIEALDMIGGQCTALYPEKPIYDIPGYPKILAADLIANLNKQIEPFNPTFHLNQQVTQLSRSDHETWLLTTSSGQRFDAKCIIIAAGAGAFGPNRPPLERLSEFEHKSVFYMVKKREQFRNQKVVIAGGGDSAVDWAISLSELAEKIYVVHRRDKFRAAPESVAQMMQIATTGKIEMITPYQLHALEGTNGILSGVVVQGFDQTTRTLPADAMLAFFGLSMDLGPIVDWGLALTKTTIDTDPTTAKTSLPGIFAVGDIAGYENKHKLILTGFSEAAFAAHSARKHIYPEQAFHFQYSTSKGVPGQAGSSVSNG